MLRELQNNISKDITIIIDELNAEQLILFILQNREYLFSPILSELSLNNNKESLLECYSYILSEIITSKEIDYLKLYDFDISDFITKNKDKLTELINLSLTRKKIKDFTIYVTKQDYKLEIKGKVITLSHDIEDYKKYYNIGYLRSSLSNLHLSMLSLANKKFDVEDAILKTYEKEYKFSELIDEDTSLARIRFHFSDFLF